MAPVTAVHWPQSDYSRIPFWLYHDPSIYAAEQERIFQGPTWNYLALEEEVPNPGDFRTSFIGDTPVLLSRAADGQFHAVVNRCAHRGAQVRREARGNAKDHICIYHRWCYGLDGNLIGVPFRRGLKGQGGMPEDFDMREHGLKRLFLASYRGAIFVSFQEGHETLEDYLGPVFRRHLDRLLGRPIRVLGYQRQRIAGNWKLYLENQRDVYHGSLLHEFQSTFGISRATHKGAINMDARHRHSLNWSQTGTDDESQSAALYRENKVHDTSLKLLDPSLVKFHDEFHDGISLAICGIFPNATFHQISNSLATRQLRTTSPDEFELLWTFYGYRDDPAAMTDHRLLQANMVGPAGLISMEDGEAIEITHRAVKGDGAGTSVIEMGGRGPIRDLEHRINDMALRGFWSYWAQLMGCEAEGGER